MSIFVGIEKLSLVDFDNKLSCILFTIGCNFKCPFCHNAHLLENQECLDFEKDIYPYLKKRQGLLDAVVISGGEPTLHHDLKDYIKKIRELGYLIKLDTNGSNPTYLKQLIDEKLIDYVAMDIKSSFDTYNDICACKVNLDNIKKSIELLKSNVIPYEFRTTVIEEYHTEEDIYKMGEIIQGASKLYLQKFSLRDTVPNKNLHEVNKNTIEKYVEILKKYNSNIYLRGY